MSFMARFRRLFWICANRPPYYDMINGSGLLYVISQCNSGVNLKKLVWPGRGWTFFILLWHGFIPAVPRARFFTPGNSFQYGIFLWWIMKIKRTLLIILSRVIRGAGMGLGTSGIALAGWFFFFSVNEYKFLWGLLSVVEFLVGYLIYRFAYSYIYDEWNDYH